MSDDLPSTPEGGVHLDVPRRPVSALHFTLTPAREVTRLADLTAAELGTVLRAYGRLTGALRRVRRCTGFNLLVNDRRHGQQGIGEIPDESPYVHVHVLGRRPDEPTPPTLILSHPERFPLGEITPEQRQARISSLWEDDRDAPPAAVPDAGTDCGRCATATGPDRELLRDTHARVVRPAAQLVPAYVLIVPLRHVERPEELSADEAASVLALFRRVATSMAQVHGSTGFNVFANDGRIAGQHVPHLHVHVLGRSATEETNPYQVLKEHPNQP